MFIAISNIDLFRFESINDFVTHSLISIEQIKQLFDDNQGNFPLPIQLEQFVLDHILQLNSKTFKRETFRDESLIDLYSSFLNDLLHWSTYTHKQIICILTLIHGLLCQIERTNKTNPIKLDEAFVHSCSILMGGKEHKKTILFNSQQYPKVIDYIIQIIFQHRHLYEILLDENPQQIQKIEENRTIDFHLFEESLFPYPLIEGLPLSIYREIILQIPPTSLLSEESDPDQFSRESLSGTIGTNDKTALDLNEMINNINRQYPNVTHEQIRQIFAEVSQEYLSEHNENIQHKLREKEISLLSKFSNLQINK
ncbi:unnamed protein product [Rotaria magnacalcarata]|uniref:Uncharacterized protein n=1 Tax=Rotaria magnacalcarata TaxID=392030 RepID=A0A819QPA6_9BILA|nr:unnamed protein product [Rotaria magnacalcarata]CAF1489468.1 unnamed protein product [Rotaria magnacalcarata]CAF2148242.1 unnamed protein product [Rotaria magnacalcarata]CAF3972568.1 unnamed protein product [Rotaria magnacalcarata]CAF4028693.1 unnamed protein product [Rotaria magnacalcarata]